MKFTTRKRRTNQGVSIKYVETLLDNMSARSGRPNEARLARLWQNWPMVMGPELAGMAMPLGQRNGILLLGGEDPMVIQELSMMIFEILERVNAFMEFNFFQEVKISPCFGKKPLDVAYSNSLQSIPPKQLPKLIANGTYLQDMNEDSPVTKCYALFVRKAADNSLYSI